MASIIQFNQWHNQSLILDHQLQYQVNPFQDELIEQYLGFVYQLQQ
jgi:hypothetical protein